MNTKSAIQIMTEMLELKHQFEEHLTSLNEQYTIKDNVFACSAEGTAEEIKEGYYGELSTYNTLAEAIQNTNICLQGIRVHDGKYSVGNLYGKLSDVQEELVIDLAESKIL